MNNLFNAILTALISGSVASAVIGLLFRRHIIRMEESIKAQYEKDRTLFHSTRTWKEQSVTQLLGPLYIQFDRTSRAFGRWKEKNLYLEAKIIRESNITIRDLLLTRCDLIPEHLRGDAGELVEHYDRWLEEFERLRSESDLDLDTPFVFVGPKGFPFPKDSERQFIQAFNDLWKELYRTG